MSANDEEIPEREIAYRLFATEYDDASLSYAESDEERAPNYVISPTGSRLNRLFVVGTLTEVTAVNDEMVRARVVDPTGAFVVYAGQYQPDELATLENLEPPAFVAVTGKARTFQPDDSDQVYTSIRPESIAPVDADTRDRWVVSAAEETLDRIGTYAAAAELEGSGDELAETLREAGVENGLAAGIPLARDHYGTTATYLAALRDRAIEAIEGVAGERDQVEPLEVTPDESRADGVSCQSLAALGDLELTPVGADDDAEQSSEPVAATTDPDQGGTETTGSIASGSAAGTAASRDSSQRNDGDEPAELETVDEAVGTADGESADDGDDELEERVDDLDTESGDGDDEPAGVDAESMDTGMYEMDDEERQQIEQEFGAEFSTGAEVESPGEADIDVPKSEPEAEAETDGDDDIGAAPSSGLEDPEDESAAGDGDGDGDEDEKPNTETDDGSDEDVDLEEYVVETMTALDDGDGADRSELVAAVADDLDVDESEVEDAIQGALMGGQCYEPNEETLKPI
ncbi:hypothetical protein [Natronobacterium gregoryi]|uniref:Rpa-associated protein n=2 Tax=Natronobacterium gregoryi TaxID=44930 RepID=L0AD72_NATGS|nr:hypothetical protein [Natronobacterium gregoryi]AFZ71853.1 hypothetical protein Natgr_0604 [Natronobacterium gregoryi SP2]ELY73077.1 hypothetical protein C490_02004 [Natronobacterium gregoryi SP2]PLK19370.1 hypothetical protein CYV19_15095 [Natronobacterium gregoryi SP2]SFJ50307.1 hypothetical protein SAMN05443661_1357 [Natronobacterium gregoryi]